MDHWKPPDPIRDKWANDPAAPVRASQHSRPRHLEHTYPGSSNAALASAIAFSSSSISPLRPSMRAIGNVAVATSLPRLPVYRRQAPGFSDGLRGLEHRQLDLLPTSLPKARTEQLESRSLQQLLLHAGRHQPSAVETKTVAETRTAADVADLRLEKSAVNDVVATIDSMPTMNAAALAAALQLPSIIGKVRLSIQPSDPSLPTRPPPICSH